LFGFKIIQLGINQTFTLYKLIRLHSISTPFISQVRDAVHKEIAELASWSMGIAASGVWPTAGFKGEPLLKGTTRYQRQGQQLALGWKILNGYCSTPDKSTLNYIETLQCMFTFGTTFS
jgi:hypothetical protein